MRPLPYIALFLAIGCYESHLPSGGPLPDASSADVPLRDIPTFDVPLVDASRPDVPRVDAGASCPGGFRLVDRQRVVSPALDCGGVSLPEVVAVDGPSGPFQLVSTEERLCDDRPSYVWTRRVGVDGERLVLDDEVNSGVVRGPAYAASNGTDFAYCTGTELRMSDASGPIATDMLRPEQVSSPGCLRSASCRGLASDGVGWGATWSRFDCDVVRAELTRSNRTGGLRDEPMEVPLSLNAIAPSGDAFAALSQGRDTSALHLWPTAQDEPTSLGFDFVSGAVALQGWGDNAWAVVSASQPPVLRVFDEGARLILERDYPGEVPGYIPVSIDFASATWGGAIVIGYGWAGGRIDSATRVIAVDSTGEVLLDSIDLDLGVFGDHLVRVAASDGDVLVHRTLATPDPESAATEVLLYRCF